jgi:hypothetical protein
MRESAARHPDMTFRLPPEARDEVLRVVDDLREALRKIAEGECFDLHESVAAEALERSKR